MISLLKLAKWFWRRFLNFINVFSLFPYYLPLQLENDMTIICTKLNSLEPRMPCAKFGLICPIGYEEDGNVYLRTKGQPNGQTDGRRTIVEQRSSFLVKCSCMRNLESINRPEP